MWHRADFAGHGDAIPVECIAVDSQRVLHQLADPRRFDRLTPADIGERAQWSEDYAKKMIEFGRTLLGNLSDPGY